MRPGGSCEPRTKLFKVIRLISVLKSDIKGGRLLESLVPEYPDETGKMLEDDVKVVVVIVAKGAEPLREHLLLLVEKCDRYDEFRVELETLARAKSAGQMINALMDLSVYEGERRIRGKMVTKHQCVGKSRNSNSHSSRMPAIGPLSLRG